MKAQASRARVREALDRYRVADGHGFDLADHPTNHLPAGLDKAEGRPLLEDGVARLSRLQELLYADARWSLLVVFQAMDAGGKDSTIKHVMSGVNPQGVVVTSFKRPGPSELAHGFLWRISQALPARGTIGIFNRSHYEDVLVARVHADVLAASRLPAVLMDRDSFWHDRLADIAAFEAYLGRQGTRVVKFFLHVGEAEQRKRLKARLDTPAKLWKFDSGDLAERRLWDDYAAAYAKAIAATATAEAPWYVIPADRKWYMRLVVAAAIVDTLEGLDLHTPEVSIGVRDALRQARAQLDG